MSEMPEAKKGAEEVLSADERQLRAQGHHGELPRQFSSFAALSLAFVITDSWVGYCATFVVPLLAGGGPTVFWGVIVAAVACLIITAGLAELASAYPSSGGQYHFAFMVSSVKTRAAAAFVTGWLSALAWCLTATSAANYCGLVVSSITMLAASGPKQPAKVVFVEYANETGWSNGMSFIIGVGMCMYAYLGTDAATHISEEVPNPGYHIPRVMCLTVLIGLGTTVPFTLALLFSAQDLDAIATSSMPILEVFYQTTGYRQGAGCFFTFWVLLNYIGAFISCVVTAGRLTWAFSRDNGLPYSRIFAKVHTKLETPVNATAICMIFCALYGLIYIGSTTAFNSIISMAILALNLSYALPQGILLFRGREKVLPRRHFRLGKFGVFVNAFSCLWCAFYTIIFCFPTFLPTTVGSMNYVSVVVAGIVLLILLFWYGGKRKTFTGPDINVEGLQPTQEYINEDQEASIETMPTASVVSKAA